MAWTIAMLMQFWGYTQLIYSFGISINGCVMIPCRIQTRDLTQEIDQALAKLPTYTGKYVYRGDYCSADEPQRIF